MNEEINHLLGYNDMKIIQRRDMFTFSLDTVLLANFLCNHKGYEDNRRFWDK